MADYHAEAGGGYAGAQNGVQNNIGQMQAGYDGQEQGYGAVGGGGEEAAYTPRTDHSGGRCKATFMLAVTRCCPIAGQRKQQRSTGLSSTRSGAWLCLYEYLTTIRGGVSSHRKRKLEALSFLLVGLQHSHQTGTLLTWFTP